MPLPAVAATLFERLGGEPGLAQISDALIERSASDPATNRSFDRVDLARVKRQLASQLCEISDGPCRYQGDTMRQVHGGLGISEAEFFGMVQHLRAILDQRGVAQADKNALLARLAPMKRDVVDPPK
ncbi:group 1 truncated hemoglobin [Chitinimonas sp.]|uniref:group I truncated hemoglobin n=1 Tax=Chitinimonas sp. TaxID=1934313 RepID=UPI0035B153F4